MKKQNEIIQKEIIEFVNVFLEDDDDCLTVNDINNGHCAEFSQLFIENVSHKGIDGLMQLGVYDFVHEDFNGLIEDVRKWEAERLSRYGVSADYWDSYKFKLSVIDARLYVGYHVWIYDGDLHYDAECPEGVENPLELPFFKQFLHE